MNNRRKLAIALGTGALAAPFGSFAQQQERQSIGPQDSPVAHDNGGQSHQNVIFGKIA
jgi:hypothetical protein